MLLQLVKFRLLLCLLGSKCLEFKFAGFEANSAICQCLCAVHKLALAILFLELLHFGTLGGVLILANFVVITDRLEDFVLVLL